MIGGCHSKDQSRKIAESVSLSYKTRSESDFESWRMNNIESKIGGFWYGAVNNDRKAYCSKWNGYLRERIRAYWGYVSALSGESETHIGPGGKVIAISCHHVYYQKSACCFWDEDERGFYVNLNTVTSKKYPKFERYYIPDGDPNKFVTLTKKEHKMTDTNKIRWIKIFEKIIEDQGGKCYLTDEDVLELAKKDGFEK